MLKYNQEILKMQNNNPSTKKIGEILVDMHFATEEQVMNALFWSKQHNQRIGATLVKQGIITIDQLKLALKEQFGLDAVTKEQISSINSDVISVLPEDLIKMCQVMPLGIDNGNLVIAMVNPNDKLAINNVIAFTGYNPIIYIITSLEFQDLLQKLF